MKAIGILTSLPIQDEQALVEFEINIPVPLEHDLLVRVKAVSVNPVDYKVRMSSANDTRLAIPKILGWDAVGIVEAVGSKVSSFKVGDEVYYAGALNRSGSNAEYQLVDERIAGRKPLSLSYEEAAAIPLVALTAWEAIFDRLRIKRSGDVGKKVLVIGGAGGVGSMAIQLLKQLTGVTVIATASRDSSKRWCLELGADMVIDHTELVHDSHRHNITAVDYILNLNNTDFYWDVMCELIGPQGSICCIVPSQRPVNLALLYNKSVSFSWELMFTRSSFQTADMKRQQEILNTVAELYDQNQLRSLVTKQYKGLTVDNIRKAHEQLESGSTIGKVVVSI
jgi:NADPH:quinone reductase